MFEKRKIRISIKECENNIKALEQKRSRSQSALVQAILEHRDPDEEDVKYFNKYTKEINDIRARLHELNDELKTLN